MRKIRRFPDILISKIQKRFRSIQPILLGVVLLVSWFMWIPVAKAAPCHSLGNATQFPGESRHTICLVEIKRSAKYPWEYRVILSQDGVKQPQEIYNCRDATHFPARDNRTQVGSEGVPVPFQPEGTGEWICRLVKRT